MSKTLCRQVKRFTDLYQISRYFLGTWILANYVVILVTFSGFQLSILQSVKRFSTKCHYPYFTKVVGPSLWIKIPRGDFALLCKTLESVSGFWLVLSHLFHQSGRTQNLSGVYYHELEWMCWTRKIVGSQKIVGAGSTSRGRGQLIAKDPRHCLGLLLM